MAKATDEDAHEVMTLASKIADFCYENSTDHSVKGMRKACAACVASASAMGKASGLEIETLVKGFIQVIAMAYKVDVTMSTGDSDEVKGFKVPGNGDVN